MTSFSNALKPPSRNCIDHLWNYWQHCNTEALPMLEIQTTGDDKTPEFGGAYCNTWTARQVDGAVSVAFLPLSLDWRDTVPATLGVQMPSEPSLSRHAKCGVRHFVSCFDGIFAMPFLRYPWEEHHDWGGYISGQAGPSKTLSSKNPWVCHRQTWHLFRTVSRAAWSSTLPAVPSGGWVGTRGGFWKFLEWQTSCNML